MVVLGIVTLFLTAFMMILYAYLANRTDHDVSFFLSVGIISTVMNLATNAAGVFVLAWLYLGIAVLFIVLSFAVTVRGTVGFFTSIGPWLKRTFSDPTRLLWRLLSLVVFPAGGALYFTLYGTKRELALDCGKSCLWGILLWGLLLWMILGIVL